MHKQKNKNKKNTYVNQWNRITEPRNKSTHLQSIEASLVAQMVKSLPVMQETQVQILSWDDPLEKGMDTLQYSCLENSRDRGVW